MRSKVPLEGHITSVAILMQPNQCTTDLEHCLHLVQVFRELDAADDAQAGDAAYLSDGSQSEAEEPAFSPAHSRGHGRGGQRRRLQVDLHAEGHLACCACHETSRS